MVAPLRRRRWVLSLVLLTACPAHSEVGSTPARAYWPHQCRVFSLAHCTPSRTQPSMPQPGLPVLIPWSPTHCANQHEHVAVVGVSNSDGSLLLTSALDRCSARPLGPWKSVDMEIQGSWRGSSVVRDTSRGAVARSSKHLQSTKRVPQSMLAHWNCGRRRMTRSTTLSSTQTRATFLTRPSNDKLGVSK